MAAARPAARGRRGALAAAAAAVALAVTGASAVSLGLASASDGPPQPAPRTMPVADPQTAPVAPEEPATDSGVSAEVAASAEELDVPTMSRSRPVALAIPSIGVDSRTLVELGKETDGSLEVPRDYGQPGWFTGGSAPGQFGPAVIAGHVDSKSGPGVFYRLGQLKPGATVTVTRADGSTARFRVDKVERYAKDRFPTVAVYGDTTHRSELRLITCGGAFDARTGHYVDNVVAYAHLV